MTARKLYTRERYLADLAELDLRRHDAPALRRLLDDAVTRDGELVAVDGGAEAIAPEVPFPLSRIVAKVARRATLLGVGVQPPPSLPVTERVLRAVGLGARPKRAGALT